MDDIEAPASRSRSRSISTPSSEGLPTFDDLLPARAPLTLPNEEKRLVIPGLDLDVKLKVDAGPGCGGIAWPAGEVLSRYLAYRHNQTALLENKTILELGSGTGLVGIVAGILEPSAKVWVTDQRQLLHLMKENVHLNLSPLQRTNVHVMELNWGETLPPNLPLKQTDLVLAADCVYFEPAFPLLVQTLRDLAMVNEHIEILFCWKKRRKADKRFFSLLKHHFYMNHVDDDRPNEREKYQREGISLLRLHRRH
ncbi:hypothetical protein M231_00957 [Tremella mesenterica]|uniref:Protein-lysine N-methyltransferase EFM6 n=1 Tax=Tremella mesenterica TaxID=5217 RepID=A0A4Q1BUQ6_TREME|nr:hypothetical protein M231_00957 [Tremella mesenterica]